MHHNKNKTVFAHKIWRDIKLVKITLEKTVDFWPVVFSACAKKATKSKNFSDLALEGDFRRPVLSMQHNYKTRFFKLVYGESFVNAIYCARHGPSQILPQVVPFDFQFLFAFKKPLIMEHPVPCVRISKPFL